MMKNPNSSQLEQIHISLKGDGYEPVTSYSADKSTCLQEFEILQSNLLQLCPAEKWHKNSITTCCPWPVLVTTEHQRRLTELHTALVLAITDIVERWWTDPGARFPERMPLERKEEDLLQWIDCQVPKLLPSYRECLGSWRPDFLVEQDSCQGASPNAENFRISEINARFSFNGFMYLAHAQQALQNMGIADGSNGLMGATDPKGMTGGLLCLFKPGVPLHLLKGKEAGMDIHMFVDFVQRHMGLTPRFITPTDLRLLADSQTGGYKLCCVVKSDLAASPSHPTLISSEGELLEAIHQVGLELHQRELMGLHPEMLRQVSLRCFNDMRTVLLVHDKRMLGIVKQEINSLMARGVLTQAQAHALDQGIADTILPGSLELNQLLQHCEKFPELKNEHVLKPIRSGKGDGIIFGHDLSSDEWMSKLELLRSPQIDPAGGTCVVQRKVKHLLYDVMLTKSGAKSKYPLIGTYHSIHGQYLGIGVWRSSPDQVCAISHGGAWTCSVMEDVSV